MRIRGANLATEEPKYGFEDRGFDYARAFQNRVAEWVHEGNEPVAVLRAPTGAGKTATFHELIEANDITLLVYPTNALLKQQASRFEDEGVATKVLTGDTLEGHHRERTENLLQAVTKYASDHDVVVTNPDILQAIVQDMYSGGQAMEFFDRFDAIVYDEFHFYGDLAASGLLLQTRIIADRNPTAQILLASATPNEAFVEFVQSVFELPVETIDSEYDSKGDRFRHEVQLDRREADRIMDDREAVVERLRDAIDGVEPGETRAVVVFNSVKDSNDFHAYIESNHPDLFERVEKDNGFDTNDPDFDIREREFSILNTTSKGEVGLDYDIRTLIMETPRGPTAASDFLQRFGRAGREANASVDVYGLGQVSWSDEMSFPEFASEIYSTLNDSKMDLDGLADLVALRAAYALHVRNHGYNPELRDDFAAVDGYDRWRGFIVSVQEALNDVGGLGASLQSNDLEAKFLTFTHHCFDVFRGLRGRSLSGDVKYPRGDRVALTNYDLLTTLRHYDIAGIEGDDVIVLKKVRGEHPMQVTAHLPGYESRPRDYGSSIGDIEERLSQWVHREIDRGDFNSTADVSAELLHLFFKRIRITEAVVPELVRCGKFEIDVENEGIPSISAHKRNV
ncbi:type I-D CRISPR-associated helicase Cas3' [Halapricum desulfuricans]|uniref:CRISPR-Cas system related heleicase, Cas3 (C-terminal HD nuclease domain) n=1 Tax=Halapricum desulfuricans TaxID=2841257 RepID=A0A897N4X0_9EURY|nr:type I-D CRISPR-associated helicase Cas3' [Halapricum desulfuricans]QSG09440.1 CRISPR-Cas system related heleicase, Cas3 (C-terminal HD nuclease domain) [Halapricum desulfuricans]